jgi:DNA-binding beta-propeller fold protein YncE
MGFRPLTIIFKFLLTSFVIFYAPSSNAWMASSSFWNKSLHLFAGSPGGGGSADGPKGSARFESPQKITVDSAGNLYVAETNLNLIRKILPNGYVTTMAGFYRVVGSSDGTGVAANFDSPKGLTVDSSGNIFVADTNNHTIRKVTQNGVVTTFAGTAGAFGSTDATGAAARFKSPTDVAADLLGNIYVLDIQNHTVRKMTSAGVVTTLAGLAGTTGSADGTGSAARFKWPRGLAVEPSGDNIYVADSDNSTIRKITSAGVVSTLAGLAGSSGSADGTGNAARFSSSSSLAADSLGNVYVADSGNKTIRKITSAGVVTTLAGLAGNSGSNDGTGSAARFTYPNGIAVDASGDNIYVSDSDTFTIRKITSAGVVTTITGVASIFRCPRYASLN